MDASEFWKGCDVSTMFPDRVLLTRLWRQHYSSGRWLTKVEAQREREQLSNRLHEYEEACRKSRGEVEARNSYWAWRAYELKEELERLLEHEPC